MPSKTLRISFFAHSLNVADKNANTCCAIFVTVFIYSPVQRECGEGGQQLLQIHTETLLDA